MSSAVFHVMRFMSCDLTLIPRHVISFCIPCHVISCCVPCHVTSYFIPCHVTSCFIPCHTISCHVTCHVVTRGRAGGGWGGRGLLPWGTPSWPCRTPCPSPPPHWRTGCPWRGRARTPCAYRCSASRWTHLGRCAGAGRTTRNTHTCTHTRLFRIFLYFS